MRGLLVVKKVLFVSNMYRGKRSETTGIFVKNQVEQLRSLGLDIDVVAIADPRRGRLAIIQKHAQWVMRFFLIMLKRGRSYDVVHAHYVFPLPDISVG